MTDLDRAVTIAEAWAQRSIMEPIKNAERMAEYQAVKPLWRCEPVVNVTSRVLSRPSNVIKWKAQT